MVAFTDARQAPCLNSPAHRSSRSFARLRNTPQRPHGLDVAILRFAFKSLEQGAFDRDEYARQRLAGGEDTAGTAERRGLGAGPGTGLRAAAAAGERRAERRCRMRAG